MKKKPPKADNSQISEEDSKFFRDAIEGTNALPAKHRKTTSLSKNTQTKVTQTHSYRREAALTHKIIQAEPIEPKEFPLILDAQDSLSFQRPHLRPKTFKQLKQGKLFIEAQLDLHKMTVVEAEQQTMAFLKDSQQHGLRCVRLVHGKGSKSQDKPRIKNFLHWFLPQLNLVLAYHSCLPKDGGTGAIYLLIKKA